MSTETTGPDWLDLTPAHFDTMLLPKRHRKPEPEGLFSVADIAPQVKRPGRAPEPQTEGQGDLFGEGLGQ